MFTIISALLGFFSSGLPSVMNYFHSVKDNQHELAMMDKQIEFQKLNIGEELKATTINAEVAQMKALYDASAKSSGVKWVDGLNCSVRPIITLIFLFMFTLVKVPLIYMQFMIYDTGQIITGLWTEHDSAILGAIVGFFFGSRNFDKLS